MKKLLIALLTLTLIVFGITSLNQTELDKKHIDAFKISTTLQDFDDEDFPRKVGI